MTNTEMLRQSMEPMNAEWGNLEEFIATAYRSESGEWVVSHPSKEGHWLMMKIYPSLICLYEMESAQPSTDRYNVQRWATEAFYISFSHHSDRDKRLVVMTELDVINMRNDKQSGVVDGYYEQKPFTKDSLIGATSRLQKYVQAFTPVLKQTE